MPGFDGTGPRGLGPMTGGARGYCVMPAGNIGPGFRRGYAYPQRGIADGPFCQTPVNQQEVELLKTEFDRLLKELEGMEARIRRLEKK